MSKKRGTVVVSRGELVARNTSDGRNLYEPSAKRKLVRARLESGLSISCAALAHGLNTNVLRECMTHALGTVGGDSKVERLAQRTPKRLPVTMLSEPTIDVSAAGAAKVANRSSSRSNDRRHYFFREIHVGVRTLSAVTAQPRRSPWSRRIHVTRQISQL